MKAQESRRFWLLSNAIFITTYILAFLPFIIRIPISIPSFVPSLLLLTSYGLTLNQKAIFQNPLLLAQSSNFYCMLLFITFPRPFLLFPFLIISYFNICSFMVLNRKKYEKYFFYNLASDSMSCKNEAYILAYFLEIVMVPFCILFMVAGRCSLFTFLAYAYCVYFEYCQSHVMRLAFKKLRMHCDRLTDQVGYGKEYYESLREYLIRNYAIKEEVKKD